MGEVVFNWLEVGNFGGTSGTRLVILTYSKTWLGLGLLGGMPGTLVWNPRASQNFQKGQNAGGFTRF